jgi:hypothetical protein
VLLATAVTALFLVGLAAPAASSAVIVGVGDQKPESFQDPHFRALGVKRTRLFTPWNSIFTQPARLDQWIQSARSAGLEPLISFEKPHEMRCPGSGCRGPSPSAYAKAFRAFRAKYPTIKLINPWNEGNSGTQPTGKNPRLNAQYFNVARRYCKGCRIVAADVLDIKNMKKWLTTFKRYARGEKLWGLHNYGDTNRFRTTGTRLLLRETRGPVWLLETGGIVTFRTVDGRTALGTSEARASRALRFLLTRLVNIDRRRIQRVYLYNWRPAPGTDRFDAGLVRADGSIRSSYTTVLGFKRLIR